MLDTPQGSQLLVEKITSTRSLYIRRISFWSLVDLCARIGIAAGVQLALFVLVASLLGWDVESTVFSARTTGVPAGLLTLVWLPLACGVSGAATGVLAYLPLKWWMKRGVGLRVEAAVDAR
jgi:hypothetical protein